jgi:tRNA pseudouridine38-40 synthase
MTRWKLTIEYDGTNFVGWQKQRITPSVQGVLENAIEKLSGQKVTLHGSGRTDSGVHALGQIAHFDIDKSYQVHEIRNALNVFSRSHAVVVRHAEIVPDTFHARFDAIQRYYRYSICNRPSPMALYAAYAWHVHRPLDCDAMRKAASYLIGRHDYSSFRASVCQAKSPIRTIHSIDIIQEGDMIYFDFIAQSFLHHQVRNIIGTLKKIGLGSWDAEIMPKILEGRNRIYAGPTAPPQGLCFMRVDYNDSGSK